MVRKRKRARLVSMTVRLTPETHRRLEVAVDRSPHLSLNALINQILSDGVSQTTADRRSTVANGQAIREEAARRKGE
jgi:hypothetical protein